MFFYIGSNGRYEYTGLRPGDFTLRVVAKDPFVSERSNPNFRAIARNRLWVHGDNVFCVTHLKNDGITVDQNTLTVDFYSTGNPTGFLCSFDRGEFFECKFLLSVSLSLSLSLSLMHSHIYSFLNECPNWNDSMLTEPELPMVLKY